ncbi:MAG: prolipoprotein diacylglyceryl transferase [Bdellovibrionales bacterium]|nr:prolipoprotein diacylglyceryl transferase [Bdellovibrionales bacterium]
MHPVLFNLGPIPIHTYGVMIAIGYLLSVWVSSRLAVRTGIPRIQVVDYGFWVLVVGYIGCRSLFIITQWHYYLENPLAVFRVWEGGLVFIGGPLLVMPFTYWYTKRYKINLWRLLDLGAIALPLAHAFGRLGCIGAGCCYGKPTDLPWGIVYPVNPLGSHPVGIPLHPTQIYESIAMFALSGALYRLHGRRSFDGQLTLTYWMTYPIIRSIIEVFRGDKVRGFVIGEWLSTSQFISMLVFIAAAAVTWRKVRVLRQEGASA